MIDIKESLSYKSNAKKFIYKDLNEAIDYIDMYNPENIYTGKRMIDKIPNAILKEDFDPLLANDLINPILEDGLRLSSGMILLKGKQNILLIPKHYYET